MENALVSAYEAGVVLVVLVDVGEGVYAPPSLVLLGVADEAVPAVVFASLRLVCAWLGVSAVLVEVDAVGARVGEHAVENDGNAELFRLAAQLRELLIRAEEGVSLGVVRRVVAVVLVSLKYGVEVDAGHAELLQIGEL